MKNRLIIIILCLWNISILYSQNYVAEYYSGNEFNGTLFFNANEWRYDVTSKVTKTFTSEDVNVEEMEENETSSDGGTVTTFNYRSLAKNYYLDEEYLISLKSQNKLVVKGELIKPEWTIITDSVKVIENYRCLQAKGYVRGRNYTVWFAPEIPVMAGPWKLWGAPGLIVAAVSDDDVVSYSLASLKPSELLIREPRVKKTVSPEEFKKEFKTQWGQSLRSIRAMYSSENTEIKDTKLNIKSADKELYE